MSVLRELAEEFHLKNLEALIQINKLEPVTFMGPEFRFKDSPNHQVECSVCGARYRVRETSSSSETPVESECLTFHVKRHIGRFPSLWVRPVKILYGKT